MLGDNMKELRLSHKYTQGEIAKMLKISKSTIGMYEQNRRTPDLETLTHFADIFNVSIDTLLRRTTILGTDSIETNSHIMIGGLEKEIILAYREADDIEKEIVHRTLHLSHNQNFHSDMHVQKQASGK